MSQHTNGGSQRRDDVEGPAASSTASGTNAVTDPSRVVATNGPRLELVGHSTLGAPDGGCTNIDVSEDRGLAALGSFIEGNTAVHIADITDTTDPKRVASVSAGTGYVNDVCWHPTEPWVVTANESGGVGIVDVSTPTDPLLIHEHTFDDGHPHTITAIDEQYAIVSGTGRGMVVLDVTNPHRVGEAAQFQAGEDAVHDVQLRGDYAYLAHRNRGLYILNMRDPTTPEVAAAFDYDDEQADVPLRNAHNAVPHPEQNICLVGQELAGGDRGFRHLIEFDVDSGETALRSSFPGPRGRPKYQSERGAIRWTGHMADWGVGDQQNVLFSGDYMDGLQVFDCTDPAEPAWVDQYYPTEGVGDVRRKNPVRVTNEYPLVWAATTTERGYVYVSDFQTGLYIFSLEGC